MLLYDVPEKPLEITGPDAAAVLERVLTCRVGTLAVGRARYGIACNDDGTVLMDGVLMRLGQDRFWYVKANGEFTHLAAGTRRRGLTPKSPIRIHGSFRSRVRSRLMFWTRRSAAGCRPTSDTSMPVSSTSAAKPCGFSRTGWTGEAGIEVYCNSGPGGNRS